MSLANKTIFISGASRGIGLAIGKAASLQGANVVLAAKTKEPHPKLPGTIYTAAEEVEKLGGKALPIVCDIRNEEDVKSAMEQAVDKFGKLDILVNNASAISLTNTEETPLKRYDLMHSVNVRGTWLVSKYAIPHLKKSDNPHIINLSPPLTLNPEWFKDHLAYSMTKFGMSLCVLGMSEELKKYKIAVNALWPLTIIYTAALQVIGGYDSQKGSRNEQILADAFELIVKQPSDKFTGNFLIDEIFLRENGVTDFSKYSCVPNDDQFKLDFFIDDAVLNRVEELRKNQRG